MSTKIYNAYEWTGTPDELLAYFLDLRLKYLQSVVQYFASLPLLDRYYKEAMADEKHGKIKAEMSFEKDLQKEMLKGLKDPMDVGATASVYFHLGRVYVQFFGLDEIPRWAGYASKSTDGIDIVKIEDRRLKDFHYQNQTDHDEEINESEWEEREKVWDEIFAVASTPKEVSFSYSFFDVEDVWLVGNKVINKYWEAKKNDIQKDL